MNDEPDKIHLTDDQWAYLKDCENRKAAAIEAQVAAQIDYMNATRSAMERDGPPTTLRDQFAMSTLVALGYDRWPYEEIVRRAYDLADAMMDARK